MRVLITGASGPIGAALLPSLRDDGIEVVRTSRRPAAAFAGERVIPWDPMQSLASETVSGMDAVVHLAGESIVGRWNAAKKQAIRESRVAGMTNLVRAIAAAAVKPRVLIGASAVGYYGDRGDEILRETSPPGTGFLPEVCLDYEAASKPASAAGIRTVLLRIGIVLSPKGGALGKMLLPFKMGLGGKLGSGNQWMSWIDVEDLVGAIKHAMATESLAGPVDGVAPNPVTNVEFTRTLASVLHRPAIFPVPAFALRLAMGEMADALLLASERVVPDRLLSSGYSFRFPELRGSLERVLKN
jgi:uncharacterized protein (TIGR01777 family)